LGIWKSKVTYIEPLLLIKIEIYIEPLLETKIETNTNIEALLLKKIETNMQHQYRTLLLKKLKPIPISNLCFSSKV